MNEEINYIRILETMSPPPFRLYIGINLFLCTAVTFMYRTCFTVALRDMVYPVSWSLVHATKEIDVSRKGQSQVRATVITPDSLTACNLLTIKHNILKSHVGSDAIQLE